MFVLGCSPYYKDNTDNPVATSVYTSLPNITPTPSTNMQYKCLEILNRLPSNNNLEGSIVLNSDYNLDAYIWNFATQNIYRFPRDEGDRLFGFNVSPDSKYIAYIHSYIKTQEYKIVITTSEGIIIWASQPKESLYLFNWFNNEYLIILDAPSNETRFLYLLNPFTNERIELPLDYPDSALFLDEWYPRWSYSNGGLPVYDPTLTRVIYPKSKPANNIAASIVIWDVESDKAIAEIATYDFWGETPLWSTDGKQFFIAMKTNPDNPYPPANEFFTVSRDGKVEQLTNFAGYFDEINFYNSYALSPNGKLLAFWIKATPSPYSDILLAILNIETKVVTNYCIKGDPFQDNATTPSSPIWSSDSTKLVVISREPQDTKTRRVVLVDIINEYAVQIEKDVEPVGWLALP